MKKSERLNKELIYLRNKHTLNLRELMDAFKISKSTALRDIASLEEMGLALYADYGRNGGYHLLEQTLLPPIYFDKNEIYAIFFALNALELLSSTPFEKSYTHIQQKLMATLTLEQQHDVEKLLTVVRYYNIAPLKGQNYLTIILESILNEQALKITYTRKKKIVMLVQMNELFYRNGIWFFSAYDFNRKRWGIYRCDAIEDCQIAAEFNETVSLTELDQSQAEYDKTFHDIPFKCRITSQGKELFLKNHYLNMELEVVNGITYIVGNYNKEEEQYMVDYFIKFGKHVVIESPNVLQEVYLKELHKILKNYQT